VVNDQPIQGQRYRYVGTEPKYRDYRGLEGVATTVSKLGKFWLVELSNLAQWRGLNLGSPIFVMSTELEPAVPASVTSAPVSAAFEGAESDLVAEITKALQEQEYLVALVGQYKAKGSGTTVGYPDMSVRRRTWPDGMACLLEVKTAEGQLSGEQEELLKLGWSYVVRSVSGAISALTRFENEVFGCK
jgi:hypothetical protein